MKKLFYLLLFILFLVPINSFALNKEYKDILYDLTGEEVIENKINIYFFYGDGCPHCAKEEKLLKLLDEKYSDVIIIHRYETWDNSKNRELMIEAKELVKAKGVSQVSVPFTVIGNKYFSGYSEYVGNEIENLIKIYSSEEDIDKDDKDNVVNSNKVKIPLLGEVTPTETSITIAAILLGFLDGFNPCAMWVLLFIINMLFGLKDKKKMYILGFAFLFTSALFYFVSILGINVLLGVINTNIIRRLIGVVAIGAGLYNLYTYYKERNEEDGCRVVDEDKRKKIITKVKKIKNARNFLIALIGIMALAISVNMVELACSAGFPAVFGEVLVANDVKGVSRILYLLLYVFFYMLDDLVVFTIAVSTLSIAGMTTKYNKIIKLIGGIIMVIMGFLLIFKYEWVMLNF